MKKHMQKALIKVLDRNAIQYTPIEEGEGLLVKYSNGLESIDIDNYSITLRFTKKSGKATIKIIDS